MLIYGPAEIKLLVILEDLEEIEKANLDICLPRASIRLK